MTYRLLRIIDLDTGDLLAMEHSKWGRQVWTRSRIRKAHQCVECGRHLRRPGGCYRPITNKSNRMERICIPCVGHMIKEYDLAT